MRTSRLHLRLIDFLKLRFKIKYFLNKIEIIINYNKIFFKNLKNIKYRKKYICLNVRLKGV